MNAVMDEQNANKSASLEDLRTFAGLKEGQVYKFEKSLTDAEGRMKNLTAERGSLLIPARSENNAKAQKRLSAIDEELVTLRRNVADDKAVLADLRTQLAVAQKSVYRAEWELKRAKIRELIENRMTGKTAAAIAKAVDALRIALQAADDEDKAIRAEALRFEPNLARDLKPLQTAGNQRSRLASYELRNALLIDSREWANSYSLATLKKMTFDGSDRRCYGDLLQTLDGLELIF